MSSPCSWLACPMVVMVSGNKGVAVFLSRVEKWAELPVPSPVQLTVGDEHPCTCILLYHTILKLHSLLSL